MAPGGHISPRLLAFDDVQVGRTTGVVIKETGGMYVFTIYLPIKTKKTQRGPSV